MGTASHFQWLQKDTAWLTQLSQVLQVVILKLFKCFKMTTGSESNHNYQGLTCSALALGEYLPLGGGFIHPYNHSLSVLV